MSTIDGDFKRKVEQAATIQLSAPFLKIPQAMRAAGFTDEDSRSAAKQMQVRRARDALRMSTPTNPMTVAAHSTAIERANRGHAESYDPHEKIPSNERGACHDR
jgi:hypothetical protein